MYVYICVCVYICIYITCATSSMHASGSAAKSLGTVAGSGRPDSGGVAIHAYLYIHTDICVYIYI